MRAVSEKFKEVLFSVLPITVLVLILNFTLTPIETPVLFRFIIGAVLIVFGLTIFLIGVDLGITPIGNTMGSAVTKSGKVWIVAAAGLVLGFFISIAEPDLHILAGQVDAVTSGLISKDSILIVVSVGIAIMLSLGLIRILYNFPLYRVLCVVYGVILLLSFFTSREFLAISFDASGATTGALTVPFVLALAIGISKLKKDSKSSEKDSFGLVAIASTGAILSVMMMSILTKSDKITGAIKSDDTTTNAIFAPFIHTIPELAKEILIALLPVLVLFLIMQFVSIKLSKRVVRRILIGLLFTFVGLVLFLAGVGQGFMEVGTIVGYSLAKLDNHFFVLFIGFILGLVTILAEPAVYVLTHQIEEVTSGYVKRKVILITLSIGVALAVCLSVLRILIPALQLWHYLLPGYFLSVGLTFIAPKLFVGIAFDAGGVASGPMTASFILAYAQGAADAVEGASVLIDGFGVIAMVAMTPIIALQLLGVIYKFKSKKGGIQPHDRTV